MSLLKKGNREILNLLKRHIFGFEAVEYFVQNFKSYNLGFTHFKQIKVK